MFYIGKKDEIVIKQCEQCNHFLAYRSDGQFQPLYCKSCNPSNDFEYINEWDIVLTDSDGLEYVIPLGTTSADAYETAKMCKSEIEKGARQARGWTDARAVPQGWPHFD
jgi:hypothetical protein